MQKREYIERQRYGRNKDTIINHAYINNGEYRSKFDKISDSKELNRLVYQLAKKMLFHRSGTLLEDMYWVDIDEKKIVASEVNQTALCQIRYSKATKKAIRRSKELLVIHTHPYSMPPSIRDFNSNLKNGYKISLVCCHDGKLYMYQSMRYVSEFLYKGTVAKYKKMGYDDFEAQICALKEYEQKGDIIFKEV
ncbi:MAG: hypothetical protein IJO60_06205 [Agathobacter sp.]|nr:hypothetical protein [Agathobacter sp.]